MTNTTLSKTQEIPNVVICDSHPIIIKGIKALIDDHSSFNFAGHASNGKELRELLNRVNANILLIDVRLNKTNIYRLIKDFVVIYPKMKIVVFSYYTMSKLIQDMMEFGVNAYLAKTCELEEIIKTMVRVLEGEYIISESVYSKDRKLESEKVGQLDIPKDNFTKFAELTEREMDIIILLSRGMTNKEMASKLNLSVYTIETHRKNVMKKLNLKTTGQLIFFAANQGII